LIGIRDCHNANVIHRDIKPSNIFLERTGGPEPVVKLIDFGVARLNEIANAGASLTSTHHLIGSMGYMAPEQLEYAKGVGPAADLYAIGVVIFRSVSGRLPFVGRSFEALQKLKCEGNAPKLSSMPGVHANDPLDEFVARALARRPEHRFGSASEMLQEWWRVVAALDREQPLAEGTDVIFDEDEHSETVDDKRPSLQIPLDEPSATLVTTTLSEPMHIDEAEVPTDSGATPFHVLVETERDLAKKRDGTDR
jgi:serine/threonine protein kinase